MECEVRGIPIYYEQRGTGRPLLMLSGWSLDHRYMAHSIEPIFEHRSGWRRLYLDLPGTGRTPGADWITCQDDILQVLLDFVDSIVPGERFAVAGVSYGGYLARGIVHHRGAQMDGMMAWVQDVELEPSKTNYPPHQVLVHNADFVANLQPEEQGALQFAVVQSLDLLEAIRATIKPARAVADVAFLKRLYANYAFSFDVDNLLEPFQAPALMLAGRQDSIAGYREVWGILDNYPRATFAVLDRAGHHLSFEQKGLFRALASEWLNRVEEYSAAMRS